MKQVTLHLRGIMPFLCSFLYSSGTVQFENAKTLIQLQRATSGNLSPWFRRWGCTHFQIKKNAGPALAANCSLSRLQFEMLVAHWLELAFLPCDVTERREKPCPIRDQEKSVIAEASLADAGRKNAQMNHGLWAEMFSEDFAWLLFDCWNASANHLKNTWKM